MAKDTKHKAIIFTGPSGGGKTTLSKYILRKFDNIQRSVSVTTRAPRENETEGTDYYFIRPEQFVEQVENDDFIEWEQVYEGMYYGTLKAEVERVWAEGNVVLFVVDVIGANSLKVYFGEDALNIFVKAPSMEVLSERLFFRGTENADEVRNRLEKARHELKYEQYADIVVINDDLQESKRKVFQIVKTFIEN